MLNFKKGLALVLAAATVVSFAPLSGLTAYAASDNDGLTTTTGIDSKPANITVKAGTDSAAIWLKEHNDTTSGNPGTTVGAFKVDVQRKQEDDGSWTKVLDFKADKSAAGANSTYAKIDGADPNTYDAAVVAPTAETKKNQAAAGGNLFEYDSYIIANKASTKDSSDPTKLSDFGGAYFKLAALAGTKGTYTVKVSALGSMSEDEKPIESSTFTVTIPSGNETFRINDESKTVVEGQKIAEPWVVTNQADITSIEYTSDNKSVVSVYDPDTDPTRANSEKTNKTNVSGGGVQTGSVDLYARTAGVADITFNAKKSTGEVVATATLSVTVNPKNGKLYVSYTASDGIYHTYTDDAAFSSSQANTTREKATSGQLEVTDGTLRQGTHLRTNDDGVLVGSTGTVITTGIKDASKLTSANQEKLIYDADELGKTPLSAKTLYGDTEKTVQINASSEVPGASISYSLVAADKMYDDTTTSWTATNTPSEVTSATKKAYLANQSSTAPAEVNLTSADTYGQRTYWTYTEKAAKKYGAIDKNGLVTLKKAADDDNAKLYVIVTVKGDGAAHRNTSTFAVPISTSEQSPVSLTVYDSKNFVQSWNGTTDVNYDPDADWNTLYMSMTDRKTESLWINANISSNYITVKSSDPSVVSADYNQLTAHKAGKATITVQTSSAPEHSGIVAVKINVVVNDKLSTNVVSGGKSVAVNKQTPTAHAEAKASVDGTTVIFDKDNLFRKTTTNDPSGYDKIGPTDSGYGDVTVTTTGNVTYQKNSGTVYIRAYARGNDKYNPSTWTYIPVNYGEQVVDTALNVDQTPIILDVKGTKAIGATASTGTAITYTSADPTIASVDTTGVVTANKAGVTTVTVSTKSSDGKDGDSATIAVIVRGSETITDDTVKKPAKVTGLKVKNKKGAKVTVTWTKQDQKNIKYYVKKTVGKKSAGKSVGSNKTTLSVAKGKTIKVKVKAYIYNAEGTKLVGTYSKTVTLKTDKK